MVATKEKISVEIIELYPNRAENSPEKFHERDSCHVCLLIGEIALEIKNVRHKVTRSGSSWVGMPGKVHLDLSQGKEGKVFVSSITFEDPDIFSKIREAIKKDLEEDFGKSLAEAEKL